jgi:hypothetical protein
MLSRKEPVLAMMPAMRRERTAMRGGGATERVTVHNGAESTKKSPAVRGFK